MDLLSSTLDGSIGSLTGSDWLLYGGGDVSSGGDGFPFGGSLGGGGIGGGGGRAGDGGVGDWSFPNSIELDGLFSFGDTLLDDSFQNSPLENVNITPPTYNINPSPPFSVLPSELDMPSEPDMPPEPLELSLVVPPMPTPQDAPPPPQSSLSEQRSSNSATKRPSPPVDEITANKRQRNNEAARKYRQKRIDRISELETELTGVKQERDDLRIRLARQEAEAAALRSMLQLKSTAAESGKDSKG